MVFVNRYRGWQQSCACPHPYRVSLVQRCKRKVRPRGTATVSDAATGQQCPLLNTGPPRSYGQGFETEFDSKPFHPK